MKIAAYKSIRPGLIGIFNRLIQLRLKSQYSHTELVFEPGDGVDHLMPDGTCEPVNGALWCLSSSASDILPPWSPKRAGKKGGVRFKRVDVYNGKWDLKTPIKGTPEQAAKWGIENGGSKYDWYLILGFILWFIPQSEDAKDCSESVASALGYEEAWRFDPANLFVAA